MRSATGRCRRGQYSLALVLALPVMVGIAGLAIDVSFKRVGQAEIQAAADAASRSGTGFLDGTDDGVAKALAVTELVLTRNTVAGEPVDVDDARIQTGSWADDGFTVSSDPSEINAIRVTIEGGAGAWIGGMLGSPWLSMAATSTSVAGGAGVVECPLPMAMPSCEFDDLESMCNTDLTVIYSPAPTDNIGWALMDQTNVNANDVRNQIVGCSTTAEGSVDGLVSLGNGQVTTALQELTSVLNDANETYLTDWDASWGTLGAQSSKSSVKATVYGKVALVGQIPLFDEDSYCPGGGKFNEKSLPVDGFATVAVFDVANKGGDKWVKMRVLCDIDLDTQGGGSMAGTWANPTVVY